MRDGVPNNITSIASLNGFLWIGTDDGLYMFDGNTFERYKAPEGERLESEQIIFVGAAGDGSLWLSYLFGGITRLKDGHLTNFTQDEGLRAGQTTSLVEDRNGAL
jgi:ligand-binding sensor domain-containing protein